MTEEDITHICELFARERDKRLSRFDPNGDIPLEVADILAEWERCIVVGLVGHA